MNVCWPTDHGWTLLNGSLDCLLFCKDSVHLVEQGNIKLATSIVSTLTAHNNQINFLFKIHNKFYSNVARKSVPATISFSFKEDDFPSLTNAGWPVAKSGNCSNHVTARSIVVLSNVNEIVNHLCQVMSSNVCSSNVGKQNACNVNSVSKLVEPLTVSKPVYPTIVSKVISVTRVM